MVDTRDLKSLGSIGPAGSSPAVPNLGWFLLYDKAYMDEAAEKGNSNWVKKELNEVKNRRLVMQDEDNDTSITNEDTEILNLPLYTDLKADGIYRYRRCVLKPLISQIGKGLLYRNLGKTKQKDVGKWPSAHAEIEEIITSAIEVESKAQELMRKKDHRATILYLVEEEYGKEAAQRLEVGAVDDNL